MNINKHDFYERYQKGELKIALIGMSNVGKSYTATRLAEHYEFSLIEVDKLIRTDMGHESMKDFAEWQGQPFTHGYAEREEISIEKETIATKSAISSKKSNTLIDTTGSVIYVKGDVLEELINNFYVVYIQVHEDHIERLKNDYFSNPKPLIWNNHYRKINTKSHIESLFVCYPELLEARRKAYEKIADKIISSSKILDKKTNINDLFKLLQPAD
ncbi:MAG: hypothetical protein HOM88_01050 [Hellea sp.]|nr:hypothetical protein [Hellea sp.]